jgi:hypothetical protein
MALCILVMVALAAPVFANGASAKEGVVSKYAGKTFKAGCTVLKETEGHVSGCLRHTFGLFNPCLDLVKGCATLALSPVEKTAGYLAKVTARPKAAPKKGTQDIPAPKKPSMPE